VRARSVLLAGRPRWGGIEGWERPPWRGIGRGEGVTAVRHTNLRAGKNILHITDEIAMNQSE
jgi:hypothetical protein